MVGGLFFLIHWVTNFHLYEKSYAWTSFGFYLFVFFLGYFRFCLKLTRGELEKAEQRLWEILIISSIKSLVFPLFSRSKNGTTAWEYSRLGEYLYSSPYEGKVFYYITFDLVVFMLLFLVLYFKTKKKLSYR